jgi:hypothetical protein
VSPPQSPAGLSLSVLPLRPDCKLAGLSIVPWESITTSKAWLGAAAWTQQQGSNGPLAALAAFSQQPRVQRSLLAYLRASGPRCTVNGPLLACALAAGGPAAQFLCADAGWAAAGQMLRRLLAVRWLPAVAEAVMHSVAGCWCGGEARQPRCS